MKAGHEINGDLLGFKFGVWEGGHRIPFIARWPGKIRAGTESDQLICQVDMLATFMALTGQEVETLQGKDSVNMLPALVDDPDEPLRTELLLAPRKPRNLAIRKGKWMYIGAQGSGGFTGSKPSQHAWGGPPAAEFAGSVNSDIENGRIKKMPRPLSSTIWKTICRRQETSIGRTRRREANGVVCSRLTQHRPISRPKCPGLGTDASSGRRISSSSSPTMRATRTSAASPEVKFASLTRFFIDFIPTTDHSRAPNQPCKNLYRDEE